MPVAHNIKKKTMGMFTLIDFRHIHKIGRTMGLVCTWIEVVLQSSQEEWSLMTTHVNHF